ncbi:MAG: TIGR02677 family protein [Actinobacteria bacterium]|nr:TIGR02677 family protein [Actinomycetota bacterium]
MEVHVTQLGVFAYVTADKASHYRAVSHVMLQAKERFRLHLRPAEIVELLADDGLAFDADEVRALLTQLDDWGNVRTDPDTAEVTSVEEFYRPRHLYQLTPRGEAAERAVRHFEQALAQPGALQTAALRDIRALLVELAGLAAEDDPDTAKAHRALLALSARFAELTDRAQVFIGNLQRTAELQRLDQDDFVAYKDLLIDYLERFIGELVVAQAEIARTIGGIDGARLHRLLDAAAERDLADTLDVTDDDRADQRDLWRRRWTGLAGWFVAPPGGQSQADVLRARARQAITALLLAVATINERRVSRADRAADLRTLARWFAAAPSDADAHRLWHAAFGLTPARHLVVDAETLDAREAAGEQPSTSWLDGEPLHVAPRLRRTGRYLPRGRPVSVVDRSEEKARLAKEAEVEAAQLAQARQWLAAAGPTRLSTLGELPRDAFDLLLDLLAEALSRKLTPDEPVDATSADGSIEIRMVPTGDGASATIATSDGALTGPDHDVEFVDLLAPTPTPAAVGSSTR